MVTLRPYQTEAAHQLTRLLMDHRVAYLRGEVRVGKSFTAFQAARLLHATKVLVVTKKKAIASIVKDAAAIGVEATVTNYEQLPKLKGTSWDLLIVDEAHSCLVGSTIVDGVKIKDMKVGHSLNSLNLASGQVEKKRVLAVIANPLNERLVKIKADGKEFVCTESHEVFTRNGWKRAGDITCEDEVCSQWVRDNAST